MANRSLKKWDPMCLSTGNYYKLFIFINIITVIFPREWKEKIDQVEDVDMDTLEFTEKKTFIFSPELSAPLTGDEVLTLVHPLLTVRKTIY